jgi:hypothetical protein
MPFPQLVKKRLNAVIATQIYGGLDGWTVVAFSRAHDSNRLHTFLMKKKKLKKFLSHVVANTEEFEESQR